VILPKVSYFSLCATDFTGSATAVQIRLTGINDTFVTIVNTPVNGAALSAGLYNRIIPVSATQTNWASSPVAFPNSLRDKPQWLPFWQKMYSYYHVLGVEYELTMDNPYYNENRDVLVAKWIDTYSSGNSTLIHPTGATMEEMSYWPDVDFKVVQSAEDGDPNNRRATIKGFYKAGSAKTNVENDEDIKTWTGQASNPTLSEMLNFRFARGWANDEMGLLNCRLSLRYIVQFKDLVPAFKYPYSGQTTVTVTVPTDTLAA
jgi:hypothetical protein